MKEAAARIKINKLLEKAGWRFFADENGPSNGKARVQVKIPLPPLATQVAIVAEIEAEQALVAANRKLISLFEQKMQATLARVWGGPQMS